MIGVSIWGQTAHPDRYPFGCPNHAVVHEHIVRTFDGIAGNEIRGTAVKCNVTSIGADRWRERNTKNLRSTCGYGHSLGDASRTVMHKHVPSMICVYRYKV